MAKPRRASYAVTSAELPVLKTLGLEEVDPEEVFELQRKEGAGAFGRVFRACYKQDRTRLAALKVIPVALEAGERGEDIESVRREIQFLRECDHPNVVAFHGAYYKDGALWVAMEHCAGGSVGDIRRVRSLGEREISVIMRGALSGLAYLHSRRKIHRDVKGGNILLTGSGQVKIADFGVSAQLRDTLSRRGSFVGTPYWMSPELIQDSDYDFKADIWSLGITAIELADQKPPLFDEHPMRVLIQIPRNPPPQVAHPEKWSAAFLDFLRFCLRKDPAERPTAVECMQHEFIRREAHIERVFASGEKDEAGVQLKPSVAAVAAPSAPTSRIEQELEDEIAEEICDDNAVLSEASSSSHSDADDEVSTGILGGTFEFRDQKAAQTAGIAPSKGFIVSANFSIRKVILAVRSTNREDSTRSSGKIFVGDPFRASHDVCVKYNSIQAQYEGAPMSAEWAALHQQFGISLSHMRCRQGTHTDDHVPALIRMLRRELVRHGGLKCKYIYRVSPVQDEVQRAKAAINRGSFEPAQLSDPHVYASLLKLWLRELPVLLLDVLDVQDLAAVTKLVNTGKPDDDDDLHLVTTGNIDQVDAQITYTLHKLGHREHAVFQWLLEHLLEVNTLRSVNQMTTQALATVMAPNLFSCAGMARSTQENAGNLMKQIVLFLRVLLSWRRASLGSSPAASTYLLEQEEKNVAAAFSTNAETPKASTLQQRKSEVTTVETKRQENVLRRVFSEFQESVLELIARYSKKSEERTWANGLIARLKDNQHLEMTMPASLERMNDWVNAALTFEAFCRLLDREQTTQEKLERLQARLGEAPTRRDDNQIASFSRNVFNHLSRVHEQQLKASTSSHDHAGWE
ncbi:hypothetical protein JG687_00004598 [Phytophthora cactorum]|uniref:Protein kinase domain-containing protein n=1 Tax=Phytophthora cactorum TaxID=29920 RepID=A0A8T1UPG3_9STRA|nr:hypothetical protein JG687_00004598 [Phytophthora cactorum]